jgi:signal-transduction protein with cAMP-binding, CBS, and nucleotidyltransferase domain
VAHTFVEDVMVKDLTTLDVSASIKDAAKLMVQKDIGCIIITKNHIPAGILTERDFVKLIAAKEKSVTFSLEEVMSSPLITIPPQETVWEAAQMMKVNNIHKLPVKENNQIIGMITTTDIVKISSLGSDSEMRRICDQIITRMQKE